MGEPPAIKFGDKGELEPTNVHKDNQSFPTCVKTDITNNLVHMDTEYKAGCSKSASRSHYKYRSNDGEKGKLVYQSLSCIVTKIFTIFPDAGQFVLVQTRPNQLQP